MAARYGYLINKWTVAAVAALALMAVVLATALPAGAQTTGQCVAVGNNLECTYAENGEGRVYDFHATDPDRGGVVIWELVDDDDTTSPDHDDFEIDRNTGVLTFKKSPNYESPVSAIASGSLADRNVYMVKVKAGDGDKTFASIGVTVRVTNLEEPGTVTLKNLQPQVKTNLGYNVPVDDDGAVNVSGQQWSKSRSMTSGYANISGATGVTYSPKNEDVGYYLRVTVTYVDGAREGHDTAMASSMYPVRAQPDEDNTDPVFVDESETDSEITADATKRNIDENTPADMNVGPPVVATDANLDVLTYSLGGTNAELFSFDQVTGQIMTKAKLDADTDGNAASALAVTVTATDPSGGMGTITVTITANNLNEAPKVSGAGAITHPEVPAATILDIDLSDDTDNPAEYTARDVDTAGKGLLEATAGLWDLTGPDKSKFNISEASPGVLSFKAAPDFEKPGDKNKDNIYEVTVVARDGEWATGTKDVTIKVTNAEETGEVTLSHTQPEVETTLTATLSDLDGGETGVKWQWHRLDATTTDIAILTDANAISGKTSRTYTPVAADAAKFLAVKVTYTDRVRNVDSNDVPTNTPESIFAVSANAVRVKVSSNPRPYFQDDGEEADVDPPTKVTSYTRYVEENENPDTGVQVYDTTSATPVLTDAGAAVTATDTDADPADQAALHYTLGGASKDYFKLSDQDPEDSPVTIQTTKQLNYETKSRHTVTVTATDPSGGKATVTVTIKVVGVDEEPKIDGMERIEYPENSTKAVGSFTGKDPEGTSIVWSLAGTDGTDGA